MNGLAPLSQFSFFLVRLLDDWIGLPEKLAASVHFRRAWRKHLGKIPPKTALRLWVHGASVGELEDILAFICDERLLKQAGLSASQIILTASSISAQARLEKLSQEKNFLYCGPLPPESRSDIKTFFRELQPDFLLLSQSDLWPLLLTEALNHIRKILWLPNRESSARFTAPLLLPAHLCTIGQRDSSQVHFSVDAPKVFIGKLRMDRILDRIEKQKSRHEHVLERHGAQPNPQRLSILLGSAWTEDAQFFSETLAHLTEEERADLQIVVLPHEVKDGFQIASIQGRLPEARVLPIEGVLLEAYQNFDLAFVGGGFATGLHNILEPALWGLPVFSGPRTRKQPDAAELRTLGLYRSLKSAADFSQILRQFLNRDTLRAHKLGLEESFQKLIQGRGASERLSSFLKNWWVEAAPTHANEPDPASKT